jgi:(p)ppGpp synthase/HD superfamily hydrolase
MAGGPLSEHPRAVAMAMRLARTARRAGVADDDAERLSRALFAALDYRASAIDDPEDPAFLHPARNALILLDDLGVADPDVLIAATLLDAEQPALMPSPETAVAIGGPRAAALLAAVPLPANAESLAEDLLTCDDASRLLALADRLDFVRHLHLVVHDDARGAHALTCSVYLPIAQHSHARLGQRFASWTGAFERRFL